MAIQKRFIHFKKFSDFNLKKLSANEANTQYTVGISGEIKNGEPDILYQSYVWIKDTKQQWTHGQLYSGNVDTSELVIERGSSLNSAVLAGEYEGYSNKAISQVSTSIGAASTAGLKGWYYTKVNLSTNQIWLAEKRSTGLLSIKISTTTSTTPDSTSFVSGWSVGDEVTIVNNKKYDRCAKITAINGNVITLDKLPFDSDTIATSATAIGDYNEPDEFSITALKITDNDTLKTRTVSSYDRGNIDFGGGSHSEGVQTYALNIGAHSEGIQTVAHGQYSHTEGFRTEAAYSAHAEGGKSIASGEYSHAENQSNVASGQASHAEGRLTTAGGKYAHSEGYNTEASGDISHAEGSGTKAMNTWDHAEGRLTTASGQASHAEGVETNATAEAAHAEGKKASATGVASHAEGTSTASNTCAHAEGGSTAASGKYSHAEGFETSAAGESSHAGGYNTTASGARSFAHGNYVATTNADEIAIGRYNKSTSGSTLFSVGVGTTTINRVNAMEITNDGKVFIGNASDGKEVATLDYIDDQICKGSGENSIIIAKNNGNKASGERSLACGYGTTATGKNSHAEGYMTTAIGSYSHAEGYNNTTQGSRSHAGGGGSEAIGDYSFAHGRGIIVNNASEVAFGSYNSSSTDTLFSIGNGTSNSDRKNVFEIKNDNTAYVNGEKIATLAQVNTTISAALTGKANVATTLAGYGIIDAYTKSDVESRLATLGLLDAASLVEITYEDLVQLRNDSRLQPGRFYRIINYWTIIDSNNLQIFDGSCTRAFHQFDIIVLALSPSTLSEEAWATHHNFGGDYDDSYDRNPEYFANSNLSAWKLWYSLDNDTTRFDWAHSERGKGVIYRMIDEFGNDCPYDFKNILFNGYYTFCVSFYVYTSSDLTSSDRIWRDASLNYTNTRVTDVRENIDTGTPISGTSLTVTTICKNNKISYNVHNYIQSSTLVVTDLTRHLCNNNIVFDQGKIAGNITVPALCCVNNSINGIGNKFTTARGLGSLNKIIANNLLSNCFNVVVDETQSSTAFDAYLVNNTLYNINYNTSTETTEAPKVLGDILASTNAYKFTGQNRLIINGDIFANNVYQTNS